MVNHLYKNTMVIAKSFSCCEAIFIGAKLCLKGIRSGVRVKQAAEQYTFEKSGVADPQVFLLQES